MKNSSIVPFNNSWPAVPEKPEMPDGISIRKGEKRDGAFIDQMQKVYRGHLGFLYSGTIEKKIETGDVLVAVDAANVQMGFIMGTKSYDRNDLISRIDQIAVVPIKARRQVGGALLQAWMHALPWGVKLQCCWCAQDLHENEFWKAQGFIPLAFRAGGMSASRMHIFWIRRVRNGDHETPLWYPKETSNGAMSAARLILPIPPGANYREVQLPRILPQGAGSNLLAGPVQSNGLPAPGPLPSKKQLPGTVDKDTNAVITPAEYASRLRAKSTHLQERAPSGLPVAGRRLTEPLPKPEPPKKPKKKRAKNVPEHVSAAREIRDRFLEEINGHPLIERGKYDPTRQIEHAESALGEFSEQLMQELGSMGNQNQLEHLDE